MISTLIHGKVTTQLADLSATVTELMVLTAGLSASRNLLFSFFPQINSFSQICQSQSPHSFLVLYHLRLRPK